MPSSSYAYTLIDPPLPPTSNYVNVSVNEINDLGQVIGASSPYTSTPAQFLYDNGSFTIFQVPGAYSTTVSQINNVGQVIGHDVDAGGTHSFVYQDGTYTDISVPGSAFTTVLESSSSGHLVGSYFDGSGLHSFIDDNGTYTVLSVPGSTSTLASAINASDQVIGTYTDSNGTGSHSFFFSGGAYTTLTEPGSISASLVQINDAGQVLGTYSTATGTNSFLYKNGLYTGISVPGARDTYAREINGNGQIGGTYDDASGTHVFIETNGKYVTVDPVPPPDTGPSYHFASFIAFNNNGDVLGNFYSPTQSGPFLYTNGTSSFLGVAGAQSTNYTWINDLGQLIGTFSDGLSSHAFLATPVPTGPRAPGLAMPASLDPTSVAVNGPAMGWHDATPSLSSSAGSLINMTPS